MKIAMIGVKGIPASFAKGGGIERHVEMLSTKLAARGHHVIVYTRSYANPDHRRTWRGVHLITLPTILRKNLETIIYVFLSTVHVLFQDVDIIHYHGVGPSTMAWIPRLFKPRAKVVVTFHSRDQFHEKWGVLARLYLAFGEWTACAFPHLTIAVSHGIRLYCEQMYHCPAVYIPNGVEIPRGRPGTSFLKAFGLQPGSYMMTLGRLIPVKAQDDAMRAFRQLESDKKLLIVGETAYDDVSYQAKLEALANDDPRVILMGGRRGEELQQLLAHCYCLIHPSRSEGLPTVVLEAMAYGKLVVMSDIPGNRELVDHSGVAYPVGNVKKLTETLQWLVADPLMVKTRGERAKDVVCRMYDWEHLLSRTEAEYVKLARRGHSSRYEESYT